MEAAAAEAVASAEAEAAEGEGVPGAGVEAAAAEVVAGDETEIAAVEAVGGAKAMAAAAIGVVPVGTSAEAAAVEAVAGAGAEAAGVEAAAAAGGAVGGIEAEAGATKAVASAAAGDCARADGTNRARRAAEPEPWWAVLDSGTEEGMGAVVELGEALEAFALSVEVAGLEGDGQLLTELEDVSGGESWRLSLIRLVEKEGVPVVQAVCVVSKARARRGKMFRMKALAVGEEPELRGRGIAAEAMRRMQEEQGCVAGSDYRLVLDMASLSQHRHPSASF